MWSGCGGDAGIMTEWNAIVPRKFQRNFMPCALLAIALAAPIYSLTSQGSVHFLPFGQIQDLMSAMVDAGAPDMPTIEIKDATSWNQWIQGRDREIRGRI